MYPDKIRTLLIATIGLCLLVGEAAADPVIPMPHMDPGHAPEKIGKLPSVGAMHTTEVVLGTSGVVPGGGGIIPGVSSVEGTISRMVGDPGNLGYEAGLENGLEGLEPAAGEDAFSSELIKRINEIITCLDQPPWAAACRDSI